MRALLGLAWLLLLLTTGCVLYVITTYTLAFVIRRPSGPRRRLIRAAFVELGATLLLMLLWPLWLLLGASYQVAKEGEGRARAPRHPVVLLHGFAMNRTSWLWLGRGLLRRGLGPLYGTSYFSPQAIQRSAEHLRDFVESVIAREDAARIDIVAHSLGGLVARYYIERLDGARRVGRLITLGAPHRGTLLGGGIALVPSARDLHVESSFLSELGRPKPGVDYTSIWSRADAIVIPADSSSIAPAGRDLVFEDLGHLSMLLSPRVLGAVAESLAA